MKPLKCVWIVDDDEIYQFTIKLQIEMLYPNAKVMSFGDGEQALNYVKAIENFPADCPQVMFLDINMPIIDGWDFLRELKPAIDDYAEDINIFMVSSSINPSDITKANDHDLVTEYVTKPITDETLKEIFDKAKFE